MTIQLLVCLFTLLIQHQVQQTRAIIPQKFLLVTTYNAIHRIDIDTGSNVTILPSGLQRPYGIDYDPVDGRIYWANQFEKTIRSANLDGSDARLVRNISGGCWLLGLSLDPMSRLLFYVDYENRSVIGMISLYNNSHHIVVDSGIDWSMDIELDKYNGVIYWSDSGKIERCNYDGSDRMTLISSSPHLMYPAGLALDTAGRRLYWADSLTHLIGWTDLDGRNTGVYFKQEGSYFIGLDIYENELFVTDWGPERYLANTTHIYRIDKNGTKRSSVQVTGRVNDVRVYVEERTDKASSSTAQTSDHTIKSESTASTSQALTSDYKIKSETTASTSPAPTSDHTISNESTASASPKPTSDQTTKGESTASTSTAPTSDPTMKIERTASSTQAITSDYTIKSETTATTSPASTSDHTISSESTASTSQAITSDYTIKSENTAECPGGSVWKSSDAGGQCEECSKGTYQTTGDNPQCTPCAAGHYQDKTGKVSCTSCPVDTYQNSSGQSACITCPGGHIQPVPGSTTCQDCPAGEFQTQDSQQPGQRICSVCQPGSYQDQPAQVSCKTCPDGTSTSNAAAKHLDDCTASPNASYTVAVVMTYSLTVVCTNEKAEEVKVAIVTQIRNHNGTLSDVCLGITCSNAVVNTLCREVHSIESTVEFKYLTYERQSSNDTAERNMTSFEEKLEEKISETKIFETISVVYATLSSVSVEMSKAVTCSPGFQYSSLLKACEAVDTPEQKVGVIVGCIIAFIAVLFLCIILFKLSRRYSLAHLPIGKGDKLSFPEPQAQEMKSVSGQMLEEIPGEKGKHYEHLDEPESVHYDIVADT